MTAAQFFALCSLIAFAPHASEKFAIGMAIGYLLAALLSLARGK